MADPVCAYVPVGPEPGGPSLVDALVAAGHDVLLPIVPRVRGPLEWARFDGTFERGRWGCGSPGGRDWASRRSGWRGWCSCRVWPSTGKGSGSGVARATTTGRCPTRRARLVIVLYEDELVDRLPAEPHDHRVSAALLPRAGLVTLGKNP